MVWAFIVIGLLCLAVVSKVFRAAFAVVLILIIGAAIFGLLNTQQEQQKKIAQDKTDDETRRIKHDAYLKSEEMRWASLRPSQAEMRDQVVSPAFGDEFKMTASVKNKANIRISAVDLETTALDCETTIKTEPLDIRPRPPRLTGIAAADQCDVIGQTRNVYRADIPPGQVRRIQGTVTFADIPKARGNIVWQFRLIRVRGDADPSRTGVDDELDEWTLQ